MISTGHTVTPPPNPQPANLCPSLALPNHRSPFLIIPINPSIERDAISHLPICSSINTPNPLGVFHILFNGPGVSANDRAAPRKQAKGQVAVTEFN